MIYFVDTQLTDVIICIPGGFTKMLCKHVVADSPNEAIHVVNQQYDALGLRIQSQQVRPAQSQDVYAYIPGHLLYADPKQRSAIKRDDDLMSSWFRNIDLDFSSGFETTDFQKRYHAIHTLMTGMYGMHVIS